MQFISGADIYSILFPDSEDISYIYNVPVKMSGCVTLGSDDALQLYALLRKLMNTF